MTRSECRRNPACDEHETRDEPQRIRDFCRASGLGRTTVYKLVKSGRLNAVKCGRATLIIDGEESLRTLPPLVTSEADPTPEEPHEDG